ncbi:hypothetical protein ACTFIY_007988 [Dictyostelium cf. discoideum]
MEDNSNNNYEENENGAQFKIYNKDKEINNPQIKFVQYDLDYKLDYEFSLGFLIVGIFSWFPLFFNFIYIRSQNAHARRISAASIVIGSSYFIFFFLFWVVLTVPREYFYN